MEKYRKSVRVVHAPIDATSATCLDGSRAAERFSVEKKRRQKMGKSKRERMRKAAPACIHQAGLTHRIAISISVSSIDLHPGDTANSAFSCQRDQQYAQPPQHLTSPHRHRLSAAATEDKEQTNEEKPAEIKSKHAEQRYTCIAYIKH